MALQARHDRAEFVRRERCVACQSDDLETLDSGRYSEDPVRSYVEQDPWGVSPLPFLEECPWEFVRCRPCGQMFQKWLLTPDWQEIRFREWMNQESIREFERIKGLDTPDAAFRKALDHVKHILRLERMTRTARGGDAVRVLDFGCGWGEFLATAKQFGFEAFGIDRAPDRQKVSLDRGVTVVPDLDAARTAAGRPFHAVTLFQVLEHVEEPLPLLEAIRGVMAPGAILVLEVPNCEGIRKLSTLSDYYNIHPLEHINCFTKDSLRAIARRAGFRQVTPPVAQVTANPVKVVKGEVRRLLPGLKSPGTNQYFVRDA
ncbi:MAG: class I SAM-dependent methyltransferase [Isosphaeraceae bacterium]